MTTLPHNMTLSSERPSPDQGLIGEDETFIVTVTVMMRVSFFSA